MKTLSAALLTLALAPSAHATLLKSPYYCFREGQPVNYLAPVVVLDAREDGRHFSFYGGPISDLRVGDTRVMEHVSGIGNHRRHLEINVKTNKGFFSYSYPQGPQENVQCYLHEGMSFSSINYMSVDQIDPQVAHDMALAECGASGVVPKSELAQSRRFRWGDPPVYYSIHQVFLCQEGV